MPDTDTQRPAAKELSPTARNLARIFWSAFLAACFGDLIFFAFIDPAYVEHAGVLGGRFAAYSVGFLFFWGLGAVAAAIAVLLILGEQGK